KARWPSSARGRVPRSSWPTIRSCATAWSGPGRSASGTRPTGSGPDQSGNTKAESRFSSGGWVGGTRPVRQQEGEAVGSVQHPRPGAWPARDAVLPHQRLGRRVDGDHAVVVVVIGHEHAAWQQLDQGGVIEPPRAGGRVVAVEDLPLAIELEYLAR